MDYPEDRRLFFTCLLLSAGLHLALAALGAVTGWGRTFQPPAVAVLEVKLVAPFVAPGEGLGPLQGLGGSPRVGTEPAPLPAVKKKPLARSRPPAPPPEPVKAAAPPAPQSLALALPPRPQSGTPTLSGTSGGAGLENSTSGSGLGLPGSGRSGGMSGVGGSGGAGGKTRGSYLGLIRSRILARRHYPPLARERQQEGVVRVRFSLSPSGAIKQGVEVVRPSGFNLLDEQARQCVLAAAPFPPFPRDLNQDHLTIEVPIVYRLTEEE
jgi:TonB family protein